MIENWKKNKHTQTNVNPRIFVKFDSIVKRSRLQTKFVREFKVILREKLTKEEYFTTKKNEITNKMIWVKPKRIEKRGDTCLDYSIGNTIIQYRWISIWIPVKLPGKKKLTSKQQNENANSLENSIIRIARMLSCTKAKDRKRIIWSRSYLSQQQSSHSIKLAKFITDYFNHRSF